MRQATSPVQKSLNSSNSPGRKYYYSSHRTDKVTDSQTGNSPNALQPKQSRIQICDRRVGTLSPSPLFEPRSSPWGGSTAPHEEKSLVPLPQLTGPPPTCQPPHCAGRPSGVGCRGESPSPASNSTSCLSLGCPARSLTAAQHLSYTGPREKKKKRGPRS